MPQLRVLNRRLFEQGSKLEQWLDAHKVVMRGNELGLPTDTHKHTHTQFPVQLHIYLSYIIFSHFELVKRVNLNKKRAQPEKLFIILTICTQLLTIINHRCPIIIIYLFFYKSFAIFSQCTYHTQFSSTIRFWHTLRCVVHEL